MLKKTFDFTNQERFENKLDLYKQRLLERYAYDDLSMYFQIFSTELEESSVRPIWESIEKIFPGKPWIGHSTAGNVADCEITSDLSVTLTIFEKPTTKFKILQYSMAEESTKDIADKIIRECETNEWVKAVEFYRTINAESPTVFSENFDVLREDIQMFGGIVCSRNITGTDSCVFSSVGGFDKSGLLVLLFGGEDFHINSFKISGWQPLGKYFTVTKADGCTIYELDGIPAYNVYKKYLKIENDDNLFVNALEFPLMYDSNGVTIVRAPAAGNEDGSIVMSADVKEGSRVRLSYGEPNTIMNVVYGKAKELNGFNAELMHVFYCTARKVFWGMDEPTTELYPFKNIKGCTGFFSHGEFMRENGCLNQNSITLVIAAMREGDGNDNGEIVELDDIYNTTKLPLAARMATFIHETTYELETMNSQLQYYNEQLRDIAKTDALTGLGNRFDFNSLLKDIEMETDESKDWYMLMIDLNGLKNTNDTYGHDAGDELIKAAANAISDAYSMNGNCYRIGGDEFVVVIDSNEEAMKQYRQALNDNVANHNKDGAYVLSMAIGEARLKGPDGKKGAISDWKMNADIDMYRSKDSFRRSRSQA